MRKKRTRSSGQLWTSKHWSSGKSKSANDDSKKQEEVSHWPAVTIYLNLINDINIDIIFKPFILKINPCAKSIPRFSPPPTKFAVIGSAMVNTFRYFVVFSWD